MAKRITERQRQVLMLRAFGLDLDEIAETLGITTGTVTDHLHDIKLARIPGVSDLPGGSPIYRLIFVMGMVEAGIDLAEVPAALRNAIDKETRIRRRREVIRQRTPQRAA